MADWILDHFPHDAKITLKTEMIHRETGKVESTISVESTKIAHDIDELVQHINSWLLASGYENQVFVTDTFYCDDIDYDDDEEHA